MRLDDDVELLPEEMHHRYRSASLSFFRKRKRCGFEAMDLLGPPESANARALAATGGVNAWNCLLLDDADLVFCRGLGDANKSGSR